ncbi:TraR/DksA C4-type zinc finger protein [Actinoplanes sp. NPDC024001]|uniref:TraR/DksA family transcriptional regulator n=1 Tax=Actinoplanes sp. NPDC024001 TaxID=3154598 RepID=UPI003405D5A7
MLAAARLMDPGVAVATPAPARAHRTAAARLVTTAVPQSTTVASTYGLPSPIRAGRGPPATVPSQETARRAKLPSFGLFCFPERIGFDMSTDIHGHADQQWLATQRAALTTEFAQQSARLTELTADTGDPAEADTRPALLAATRQNLAQLGDALRRIAEGTYGRCQGCGQQINPERLEILPYAAFCMPCQRLQKG